MSFRNSSTTGTTTTSSQKWLPSSKKRPAMRMYKTGSKWALWRWSWAPDKFIVRLHLLKTPWFAICMHWINHADAEPFLHDHPVSFLSVILRGWYDEARYVGGRQDGYIHKAF